MTCNQQRDFATTISSTSPTYSCNNGSDFGIPSSRSDAIALRKWFKLIITKITDAKSNLFEERCQLAEAVYYICFKEIIRQVSVQCIERGDILATVWMAYITLIQEIKDHYQNMINSCQNSYQEVLKKIYEQKKAEIEELKKQNEEKSINFEKKAKELSDLKKTMEEIKQRYTILQNATNDLNTTLKIDKLKAKIANSIEMHEKCKAQKPELKIENGKVINFPSKKKTVEIGIQASDINEIIDKDHPKNFEEIGIRSSIPIETRKKLEEICIIAEKVNDISISGVIKSMDDHDKKSEQESVQTENEYLNPNKKQKTFKEKKHKENYNIYKMQEIEIKRSQNVFSEGQVEITIKKNIKDAKIINNIQLINNIGETNIIIQSKKSEQEVTNPTPNPIKHLKKIEIINPNPSTFRNIKDNVDNVINSSI